MDAIGVGTGDTSVAGETLLEWQDPQVDPGTGERTVATEMLSLSLTGSSPQLGSLEVKAGSQCGLPATLGSVVPLGPGGDFPARATFDVFFEVTVGGVATLRNAQPLVMAADINEIPPRNIGLTTAAVPASGRAVPRAVLAEPVPRLRSRGLSAGHLRQQW